MYTDNSILLGKLDDKSRDISIFEYLYVLVFIIYGGMASTFVRSFSQDKPLAILLPVLLAVILTLKSRIVFNKQIYLLLLFYLIYYVSTAIKFMAIHPIFFGYLLVNFLITYITVKALRFKLFMIYERLIYLLSIIGLIMWGIQLAMGGDNLFNLLGKIPNIDTFSNVTGDGLNIIIYSVQPSIMGVITKSSIVRNCGFAWEPGGFAVHLCLAIFINLFLIKSSVKLNRRFWILVLALITTQSTTGYIIFIIIIIFYIFQANMKVVILLFPILIIGIALAFSLPFMKDKIIEYFNEASQVDVIVAESIGTETTRNPQRFASFIISFRDFINHPILGYGGQVEERWFNKIRSNIAPISGIGNLLAQYGLVGFIFFMTLLINSSRFFSRQFNYNGSFLLFIIMILITISYSLIFTPVIMSFWMFHFFEDSKSA